MALRNHFIDPGYALDASMHAFGRLLWFEYQDVRVLSSAACMSLNMIMRSP